MAPSTWLVWGKCRRNGSLSPFPPAVQGAEVITCEGIAKFDVAAHGEKYLGKYHMKSKRPDYTCDAKDRFLACSGLKVYVNTRTDKDLYSSEFFPVFM